MMFYGFRNQRNSGHLKWNHELMLIRLLQTCLVGLSPSNDKKNKNVHFNLNIFTIRPASTMRLLIFRVFDRVPSPRTFALNPVNEPLMTHSFGLTRTSGRPFDLEIKRTPVGGQQKQTGAVLSGRKFTNLLNSRPRFVIWSKFTSSKQSWKLRPDCSLAQQITGLLFSSWENFVLKPAEPRPKQKGSYTNRPKKKKK